MKLWKKARNEYVKRVRQAYKEKLAKADTNWINFKNTGKCLGIGCGDCPLLGKMCCNMSLEDKKEEINKEVKE